MKFLLSLLFCVSVTALYPNAIQKLFLHVDKSMYVENENICFAAYITGDAESLTAKHKILSVMLFRDDDRVIIRSAQFVMQGGVASGMITVPDTIMGGNYRLYAYTDIIDNRGAPLVSFIGRIIIRNTRPQTSPPASQTKLVASAPFAAVSTQLDTIANVNVSILPDRESYDPRETVKLKVSLTDAEGKALKGLFSIAAVQSNRLAAGYRKINIVAAETNEARAIDQSGFSGSDTVVQGEFTAYSRHQLVYRGRVTRNRKPVKKVVDLVLLSVPGISTLSTDDRGLFELDPELLYSEKETSIRLLPKGTAPNFELQVSNPFDSLDKVLVNSLVLPVEAEAKSSSDDFLLKEFEKYDQLDKVTVTARTGNTLYGYKGKPGPNACGDYVDEFDYLNYEFSKNRYQPVVGKAYKKRTDLNDLRTLFKVDPVHYTGCRTGEKKNGIMLEPIHYNQLLATIDETISEPQFLSTLLWKPFVLTDTDGTIELNFITGDIKGSFTIMVQGITDSGVFSGDVKVVVK